jgi:hypothetical protein
MSKRNASGKTSRRLVTLLAAITTAAAFSVAVAAPAEASSAKCQEYLRYKGYTVGPKVRAACDTGQNGGASGPLACYFALIAIDVEPAHASTACNAAND